MAVPVILDCDTGTDDAVAIMCAALHPGIELLGVCTVWGNHDVRHTTDNSLRVLDLVGAGSVPVVPGLNGPFRGGPRRWPVAAPTSHPRSTSPRPPRRRTTATHPTGSPTRSAPTPSRSAS